MQTNKLYDLSAKIMGCTDCLLYKNRTIPIPGIINTLSPIVFIVNYPNRVDDKNGQLRSSKKGKETLFRVFRECGLDFNSISLLSCLKCTIPHKYTAKSEEAYNLLSESLNCCSHHLKKQLEYIAPRVVVLLGKIPLSIVLTPTVLWNIEYPKIKIARGFRNTYLSMSDIRGKFLIGNTFWGNNIMFFATWDPKILFNKYIGSYRRNALLDYKNLRYGIRAYLEYFDNPKLRAEYSFKLDHSVETKSQLQLYDVSSQISEFKDHSFKKLNLLEEFDEEDRKKCFIQIGSDMVPQKTRKLLPRERELLKREERSERFKRTRLLREKRNKQRSLKPKLSGV